MYIYVYIHIIYMYIRIYVYNLIPYILQVRERLGLVHALPEARQHAACVWHSALLCRHASVVVAANTEQQHTHKPSKAQARRTQTLRRGGRHARYAGASRARRYLSRQLGRRYAIFMCVYVNIYMCVYVETYEHM